MNEELLAQLIADARARAFKKSTPRSAQLPWLDGKADAVIGMRRAGKTTFVFQRMKALVEQGWTRDRLLYINFEDERLAGMTAGDLGSVVDVFYRENPALREVECALFFDEIQNVPGWEKFVRRLLDTENVHVCVTGSSAALLSREIATSLRGRAISTEIAPFCFTEYLAHQGLAQSRAPATAQRSRMEHAYDEFLVVGGFPEVQGLDDSRLRIRILQEYVDVVLLRDIIERHEVSNVAALRALVRWLLAHPGAQLSVNKFYNDLKSRGMAVSKNTLYDYLQHVEDAFLAFVVPIFSSSERVRRVNPAKVYVVDVGLARANQPVPRPDVGHLLENAVYLELRRHARTISYYKTQSGREIDFVTHDWEGNVALVQVAADALDASTRKRELQALVEAARELEIENLTLVTLYEDSRETVDGFEITILPAWRHARS